jgi:hypothetical protein
MTWLIIEIKLPEECRYRVEFPGHPDDCAHKKGIGRCARRNCPYLLKGGK